MKNRIEKQFELLDPVKINREDSKGIYDCFNISIHSKFLNEEEADNQVVFYSKDLNNEERLKYNEVENRYLGSLSALFEKYICLSLQINKNYVDDKFDINGIDIIELEKNEFKNYIINGLREIREFIVIIPELDIIIRSDFDLELIVFSKRNDEKNLKRLFSFFEKNNFYLLR